MALCELSGEYVRELLVSELSILGKPVTMASEAASVTPSASCTLSAGQLAISRYFSAIAMALR